MSPSSNFLALDLLEDQHIRRPPKLSLAISLPLITHMVNPTSLVQCSAPCALLPSFSLSLVCKPASTPSVLALEVSPSAYIKDMHQFQQSDR